MTNLTQNNATSNNQPLIIGNFTIRQDEDGRYSLADLHKASGNLPKHKPSNFLRVEQTQELIKEIEQVSDMSIGQDGQCSNMRSAVKVINGGNNRGTYAVKEMVYAYAMWISAKFHLQVIRAYDALVMSYQDSFKPSQKSEKTTKKDREALNKAVVMYVAKTGSVNYSEAYTMIHQRFNVEHTHELTHEQLDEAIKYIHSLLQIGFVEEGKNSYFLHDFQAHEFDTRMRSLFDIANLFEKQAHEMNRFLTKVRK